MAELLGTALRHASLHQLFIQQRLIAHIIPARSAHKVRYQKRHRLVHTITPSRHIIQIQPLLFRLFALIEFAVTTAHRLRQVLRVHLHPTQFTAINKADTNQQHSHTNSQIFPFFLTYMHNHLAHCHHTHQHRHIVRHLRMQVQPDDSINSEERYTQPILAAEYSIHPAYHRSQCRQTARLRNMTRRNDKHKVSTERQRKRPRYTEPRINPEAQQHQEESNQITHQQPHRFPIARKAELCDMLQLGSQYISRCTPRNLKSRHSPKLRIGPPSRLTRLSLVLTCLVRKALPMRHIARLQHLAVQQRRTIEQRKT